MFISIKKKPPLVVVVGELLPTQMVRVLLYVVSYLPTALSAVRSRFVKQVTRDGRASCVSTRAALEYDESGLDVPFVAILIYSISLTVYLQYSSINNTL